MSKMADIQNRVDEAIASLDGIQRAQPKAFFFTRLEARLLNNRSNSWERIGRAVSRPAVAIATLTLVLVLNVAVIVQGMAAVDDVPDLSEMSSTEDLRASTSFYDIENNQP